MLIESIWQHFKAIPYGGIHMGAVVYIDLVGQLQFFPTLGKPLIFSGVTRISRVSTINAAEEIIAEIMRRENISATDRDFYDLQTRKGGYCFTSSGTNAKIGFVLDRLNIEVNKDKISVGSWSPVQNIPQDFREIFYCLIQ